MSRQTTVSLLAAVAFGAIMAAATAASGEANLGGGPAPTQHNNCPTQTQYECVARCAPPGSSPEQNARCRAQCRFPDYDPMDCQYLRRPQTAAPNATVQGAPQRRR
jgi:hypothetical protein